MGTDPRMARDLFPQVVTRHHRAITRHLVGTRAIHRQVAIGIRLRPMDATRSAVNRCQISRK